MSILSLPSSNPIDDPIAREAARILSAVLNFVHVAGERRGMISIAADLPADLFDRMTVWGAAAEDIEDQGDAEDDGDNEREDHE